jgi:hypothetical protein
MKMKPIVVKYSAKCSGCQDLLCIGTGAYYSPGKLLCGRCYINWLRDLEASTKPTKKAKPWVSPLNYHYHDSKGNRIG